MATAAQERRGHAPQMMFQPACESHTWLQVGERSHPALHRDTSSAALLTEHVVSGSVKCLAVAFRHSVTIWLCERWRLENRESRYHVVAPSVFIFILRSRCWTFSALMLIASCQMLLPVRCCCRPATWPSRMCRADLSRVSRSGLGSSSCRQIQ